MLDCRTPKDHSMSDDEIIRCYCNNCGRSTEHRLLDRRIVDDEDESDGDSQPFYWTDTYESLQCLGCKAVCLRQSTKDAAGAETTILYPPPISRRAPLWRWHLPDPMKELLAEIYIALHNNSPRLALMGARTLVDMLMLKEVGDVGTFDAKLTKLLERGVISARNRAVLSTALDAGSAAAHRGYKPGREELEAVMDIVENLLQSIYHLSKIAEELKAKIPRR